MPTDADGQSLQMIVLTGQCPNCGCDSSVTAIEYEFDNEVWFQCSDCDWDNTYSLSDAKEAGYYFSWGQKNDGI